MEKPLATKGKSQPFAMAADIWWHHGVSCSPVMASSPSAECGCLSQVLGLSVKVTGWHISNMAGIKLDGPEAHLGLKHLLSKSG